MRCKDHGFAAGAPTAQDRRKAGFEHGIHSLCRLIQHKDIGTGLLHFGKGKALCLSPAEIKRIPAGKIFQQKAANQISAVLQFFSNRVAKKKRRNILRHICRFAGFLYLSAVRF